MKVERIAVIVWAVALLAVPTVELARAGGPVCGDGFQTGGETCETPRRALAPFGNACRAADCRYCGDGGRDREFEQCDSQYGSCQSDCRYPPNYQLTGSGGFIDHEWAPFELYWTVENPVIIAGPATAGDPDGGVVRIRNVAHRSFEARFQEWADLDGVHGAETFGYLALPRGSFALDDGSVWHAGTFELPASGRFERVPLPPGLHGAPRLFLTVQTDRGGVAVGARVRNVTQKHFEAGLFFGESYAPVGDRQTETVGYLAIDGSTGSGVVRLGRWEAKYRTERFEVDHRWTSFLTNDLRFADEQEPEFVDALRVNWILIAQEVDARDLDPAVIRRRDPDGDEDLQWGILRGVTHETSHLPIDHGIWGTQIFKPLMSVDLDPALVRSRATLFDGHGAEIRLSKWPYSGDVTTLGDTFFLSGDRGDVGDLKVDTGWVWAVRGTFTQVEFRQPFDVPPAIFAACELGRPAVGRIRNVTVSGFEAKMSPQEADLEPGTCFFKWVAIEPGHGETADGRSFDVFRITAEGDPVHVAFPHETSRAFPTVVVDVNSYNGSNPVFPRVLHIDATGALLLFQEEQSADAETVHRAEEVVIFVGN